MWYVKNYAYYLIFWCGLYKDTIRNIDMLSSLPKKYKINFLRILWVYVNIWRDIRQEVELTSVCMCVYTYTQIPMYVCMYVLCAMYTHLYKNLDKAVYMYIIIINVYTSEYAHNYHIYNAYMYVCKKCLHLNYMCIYTHTNFCLRHTWALSFAEKWSTFHL